MCVREHVSGTTLLIAVSRVMKEGLTAILRDLTRLERTHWEILSRLRIIKGCGKLGCHSIEMRLKEGGNGRQGGCGGVGRGGEGNTSLACLNTTLVGTHYTIVSSLPCVSVCACHCVCTCVSVCMVYWA